MVQVRGLENCVADDTEMYFTVNAILCAPGDGERNKKARGELCLKGDILVIDLAARGAVRLFLRPQSHLQ